MSTKESINVGLDIGSHSIKIAAVSSAGDSLQLLALGVSILEKSSKEAIVNSLQDLAKNFPDLPKRVRVSLNDPSLIIRQIALPKMTTAELKGAIRFEAEQQIPFPIDNCMLDFQILKAQPQDRTMQVLLAAAKKELIEERINLLKQCGLEAEVIDLDAFAVLNAFEMCRQPPERFAAHAIIQIGHHSSLVNVAKEDTPILMREIKIGGYHLTSRLAEHYQKSFDEAEKIKISREKSEETTPLLHEVFEPLIMEVHHSFDYFENQTARAVEKIFLCGGGALSNGLDAFFTERLGIPTEIWDVTQKITLGVEVNPQQTKSHGVSSNVAIGLALRRRS